MAVLAAALPYISAAGTIFSAVNALQQGSAQKKAANYQAAQLEQQAGQERASAQRGAIEQRKRATLASSRVKSLSAASGGGVLDPSIVDITGDIGTQGEYNALSALYAGEERGRGLEMGASAKRFEGAEAKRASYYTAAGTLFNGLSNQAYRSSLMDKYSPTDKPGSFGYG